MKITFYKILNKIKDKGQYKNKHSQVKINHEEPKIK